MSKQSSKTNSLRGPMIVIMLLVVASLACTISTHRSTLSSSQSIDTPTVLPTMTPWATLTPVATATDDAGASVVEVDDQSTEDLGIVTTNQSANLANQTGSSLYTNLPVTNTTTTQQQQPVAQSRYVVNNQPPVAACGITAAGDYNVNIRSYGDLSAPVIGTLSAGSWVYALGLYGLWYQIDVPGTPVDGGWIYAKVVGLREPCTCTPDCSYTEWTPVPPIPPAGSYCQLRNYMAQGVMSEPYGQGYPVYQLGPNTVSTVLAKTSGGGVYKIDTLAGPGWTNGVENVELIGDCSAVPVVDPPIPQACELHNFMAQGVMSEPYGQGTPIYQLGPDARSTVFARTSNGAYRIQTPAGPGWVGGTENFELIGNCGQLPVEDLLGIVPGTYRSAAYRFAVDYPAPWYVTETGTGATLTSYDPANGDPAHAVFADPSLVKISISVEPFAGDLDAWKAQFMQSVDGVTLSLFDEYPVTTWEGVPAVHLDLVSGTGGVPVFLAVMNGYGFYADGIMANHTQLDQIMGTLRAQ